MSDLFDPRSGYPLLSMPGLSLDDNATVNATLNYPVANYLQCSILSHPIWLSKVYPATIVTTAPVDAISKLLDLTLQNRGWQLIN